MLTINLSELILTVVSFFLLLFLMKRLLYAPLAAFMDARRARIEEGLDCERAALAAKSEMESARDERRRQSMEEAKRILNEAKAAEAQRHDEMVAQARALSFQDRRAAKEAAAEWNGKEAQLLRENRERLAALLAQRLLRY